MTIKEAVLQALKEASKYNPGYWDGYDYLQHRIFDLTGKWVYEYAIKKVLIELKSEGKVKTEPIFKEENGLLNGSGWFFVND